MPSTFSSALPFLIFGIVVAIIGMVVANLALILDLRKRQQEHKEGLASVWYQRSKLRDSLRGIGLSSGLLFLVGAFGYSLAYHSPIWTWIFCMLAASIFVVGPSVALVRDLRKMRQERQKGLPSVWHQQPATLKQFGQIA